MKRSSIPYLLSLFAFCLLPVSADVKIGVVDLNKAFTEYYKTKVEEAKLNQKAQQYQQDFQQLQTKYQLATEVAQQLQGQVNDPSLSAEAKADKNNALQQKIQDIRDMEHQLEEMKTQDIQALQQEQMQETKDIIAEINKLVSDYSAQSGFDIMVDKSSLSAHGTPVWLYLSPKLTDITQDIITKLNSTKPPGLVIPTISTNGAPTGAASNPTTTATPPPADNNAPTVHY